MTNFDHTRDPGDNEPNTTTPNTTTPNTTTPNTTTPNTNTAGSAGQPTSGGRTPRSAKVAVGAAAVGLAVAAIVFGWPNTGRDTNVDSGVTVSSAPSPGPATVEPQADHAVVSGAEQSVTESTDDRFPTEDGDDLIVTIDSTDDVLGGDHETEDAIFDGIDQGPAPDPVVSDSVTPGLAQLCPSVVHGRGTSGIWVRGKVYGLQDGWIFVEGPTVNGGQPVEVPVTGGAFNSPLPIVQYGDHELTRIELGSDGFPEGIDLLPLLLEGSGNVFPVGPDEGSIFDDECFEFGEEALDAVDETNEADPDPAVESAVDANAFVEDFLDEFVTAHRTGDVDALQASLHPTIRLAYGGDVCSAYVEHTVGTIADATLVSAGEFQQLDMNTPGGMITFPEAAPFTVEFTFVDGSTVLNEAHLPMHDGAAHWLTTCGVDTP